MIKTYNDTNRQAKYIYVTGCTVLYIFIFFPPNLIKSVLRYSKWRNESEWDKPYPTSYSTLIPEDEISFGISISNI